METILIIVLVLFLLGGGGWGYSVGAARLGSQNERVTIWNDRVSRMHVEVRL